MISPVGPMDPATTTSTPGLIGNLAANFRSNSATIHMRTALRIMQLQPRCVAAKTVGQKQIRLPASDSTLIQCLDFTRSGCQSFQHLRRFTGLQPHIKQIGALWPHLRARNLCPELSRIFCQFFRHDCAAAFQQTCSYQQAWACVSTVLRIKANS